LIPKECRVYKVLKTILLSRPARDNDVRFRYSNRAGTGIGGDIYKLDKGFSQKETGQAKEDFDLSCVVTPSGLARSTRAEPLRIGLTQSLIPLSRDEAISFLRACEQARALRNKKAPHYVRGFVTLIGFKPITS
jgi:hypothetical protein